VLLIYFLFSRAKIPCFTTVKKLFKFETSGFHGYEDLCHSLRGYAASVFTLKVEAAKSSESLMSYHITARRHNPEDCDMKRVQWWFYVSG
jgi:hypothetical protein